MLSSVYMLQTRARGCRLSLCSSSVSSCLPPQYWLKKLNPEIHRVGGNHGNGGERYYGRHDDCGRFGDGQRPPLSTFHTAQLPWICLSRSQTIAHRYANHVLYPRNRCQGTRAVVEFVKEKHQLLYDKWQIFVVSIVLLYPSPKTLSEVPAEDLMWATVGTHVMRHIFFTPIDQQGDFNFSKD